MRNQQSEMSNGQGAHRIGGRQMEITHHTNQPAGDTMATDYVCVFQPDTRLEAVIWGCTVCGCQGRGVYNRYATPTYCGGRAQLGAACCCEPSLALAARGLYRGREANSFFSSGRLRGKVYNETRSWLAQSHNLFAWLASL